MSDLVPTLDDDTHRIFREQTGSPKETKKVIDSDIIDGESQGENLNI